MSTVGFPIKLSAMFKQHSCKDLIVAHEVGKPAQASHLTGSVSAKHSACRLATAPLQKY